MTDFQKFPTSELIPICSTEYLKFKLKRQNNGQACFELFRRALGAKEPEAWEGVFTLYWRLVAFWVDGAQELIGDHVNDVFIKLFREVNDSNFDCKFADFSGLMGYLKMIAINYRIDHYRKRDPIIDLHRSIDDMEEKIKIPSASEQIEQKELLEKVYSRMKDEKERLVLRLFLLGYTPRLMLDENQGEFEDIKEIYRILERILLRLRSDPGLAAYFEQK